MSEKDKIAETFKMSEAEKLFNEIHARCLDRWRFILSFRTTSKSGMEAAKKEIKAQKITFVTDLLTGNDYDKILIDKEAFFKANPPEQLVQAMTDQTIKETEVAMNAASVVFAHSVLDGAAFDYLPSSALVAPEDWASVVEQRRLTLAEMRGADYPQVLKQKTCKNFSMGLKGNPCL